MSDRRGRLILVASRLPVTLAARDGKTVVEPSPGGLATALRSVHHPGRTLWIGSLGEQDPDARAAAASQLAAMGAHDVRDALGDSPRPRDGFSNGVLWPLFHYLTDKVDLDADADWARWKETNVRFADAVAAQYRTGDRVWVHDYQLALLPALLRERLPDAPIGFFLHIPFPSPDVFRILPWRDQVLRGILGSDLIGFHTEAYRSNFLTTVTRLLGHEVDAHRVRVGAREVRVGAFPLGVDVDHWELTSASDAVASAVARLRASVGSRKLVVGIDRLDYTKGIPRRLLAFERLLERHPSWRGNVRFIQVAVPTRESMPAYGDFRHHVASLVGKINGAFGSVDDVPVHFLYRSLPTEDLVALYRAADVMVVTPLRDGMNLVAKEFVASRVDGDGVLVLSELAGAAAELSDALLVNPYDVGGISDALHSALTMTYESRTTRMMAMRKHVSENPVSVWASSFVAMLDRAHPDEPPPHFDLPAVLAARVASEPRLRLMLDYDGTLVAHQRTPDLAAPDPALRALLDEMTGMPDLDVHIVSGRPRTTLEAWFGTSRLGLHAEHGFWSRMPGDHAWKSVAPHPFAWMDFVRPVIEALARRVPGSFMEEKDSSLAWHYRAASPDLLREELRSLRAILERFGREHPVEILEGAKVIELRARGVNKGLVARALQRCEPQARVLCVGDDTTDEDMFAALGDDAVTIRVGDARTRARHRLAGPPEVRALLVTLLEHTATRSGGRRSGASTLESIRP